MNFNKYTLFLSILFGSLSLQAQQANIFFDTDVDCLNNQYCATVKINAINDTEYEVGTSSILMEYNEDALEFASYKSHSFDKSSTCKIGNEEVSFYDDHVYDKDVPGLLNTTMTLTTPGFGCPSISKEPVDVATICFNIKEMGANSGLKFERKNTNLNKGGIADVQIIESLDMIHAQQTIECDINTNSQPTNISESDAVDSYSVEPNPFVDYINVNIGADESDDLTIQLYDVKGRLLKNVDTNIFVGANNFSLDTADIPSGIYLLEVKGGDFEKSLKLIKN